jgi:MoaA/NifB/PqqE/SkfB family radical SAM enzyme
MTKDVGTGTPNTPGGKVKGAFQDLDPNLARVIFPWALKHPKHLVGYARLTRAWKKSRRTRKQWREKGMKVPSVLIFSVTPECNLSCAGCFAAAAGNVPRSGVGNEGRDAHGNASTGGRKKSTSGGRAPLKLDQWRDIVTEASGLGVYCFILAGGEPFLVPDLLSLPEQFRDRIFLVYTNGTALGDSDFRRLKKLSNVMVYVSVEGGRELTDARRGAGVHDRALDTLERLRGAGVICGISVTVTRMNHRYWMDFTHMEEYVARGISIGVFIEYIPLTPGSPVTGASDLGLTGGLYGCSPDIGPGAQWTAGDDHAFILTPDERKHFRARMVEFRHTKSIYIIHSPGDEDHFGGCVSAGRGFAHVTPAGDLTPCPVSNIATHNLTRHSLADGLRSPLFTRIRESEHLLENEGTPCALFAHPKEVEELAREVKAYRTDMGGR